MKTIQIESLIEQLDRNSPYFSVLARKLTPPGRQLTIEEAQSIAVNDLQFVFHFADRYAARKQPLPIFVTQSTIVLSYEVLMGSRFGEAHRKIARALTWLTPENRAEWAIIKGYACCRDLKDESAMAARLDVDAETLHYGLEIGFDLRSRWERRSLVARLLYPGTRLEIGDLSGDSQAKRELVMRRVAFEQGVEAYERLIGISGLEGPTSANDSRLDELETHIAQAALLEVHAGGIHRGFGAALNGSKALLIARRHARQPETTDDDMRRGIGGLSLGKSLMESYLQIAAPDIARRTKLQAELMARAEKPTREPETSSTEWPSWAELQRQAEDDGNNT